MPGLLALVPPRNAARGREQDRLLVYLLLTGNSTFTTTEYMQVAENAAKVFYSTSGSLTNALRVATETINKTLLDRNMASSSRGQYVLGWLTIAAVRESQCTFLLSGPMHVYHFGQQEARHVFEPNVSGKGLGMSQTAGIHYAQVSLQAGDRLLFCGKVPGAWDSTLNDPSPSSLDAMRRRLTTLTSEDLNAVLIQSTNGTGLATLLSGTAEIKAKVDEVPASPVSPLSSLPRREEVLATPNDSSAFTPEPESPSAHMVQPSAYAIPQQVEEPVAQEYSAPSPSSTGGFPRSSTQRDFPSSIPRLNQQVQSFPVDQKPMDEIDPEPSYEAEKTGVLQTPPLEEKVEEPVAPREPSAGTRRAAKTLASSIQASRRIGDALGEGMKKFLPRLLPNTQSTDTFSPSNFSMVVMAVLVPLIVVTIASVVYLRYGRSLQYETYLGQAQELRNQALTLNNPIEQRKAWENVLLNVDIAESHRETSETISLRQEAEANLDILLGIARLQFNQAFSTNLGVDISRMSASETDLFLLNAANGEVLRAQLTNGRGFQLDTAFNCRPGVYGNYTVGPLVDILAMPTLNSINATLLGVDAGGNLLYCAPGQVAQAIPLAVPDTNWGRVTAFVLDGGNLYVLDAPSRAVWVYNGKDGAFIDRPYFFFSEQTPTQDVIDLIVSGDELYMLHADGHLSNCSYSRIEASPSQCRDPFPMVNPYSAYQDVDLFGTAHFTQILFAAAPDQSILLLDADTQGVMRFAPRSMELQNQFRPTTNSTNPIPSGAVDAVTVGPNHVIYLALDGQVYFASMP